MKGTLGGRVWRWTIAVGVLAIAAAVIRATYAGVPLFHPALLAGIAVVVLGGAALALEGSDAE